MESITGRKKSPWKSPKATNNEIILKKVVKTCDCEKAIGVMARNVDMPPCRIAGLMEAKPSVARCRGGPSDTRKACAMWAP